MKMVDVKRLMKEVGWGVLATTDGRKVGARPMGGWAWVGKELWCATGKSSDKVKQLRKVPHAEYCFVHPDGRHVRIAGPVTVSTDKDDKCRLYDLVPGLRKHIADPASPQYVVLRMKPRLVRIRATTMGYEKVRLR